MIDFFVQSVEGQPDRRWARKRLSGMGLHEADLENALFRNPDLLCLERLGLIVDRVHVVQQASAVDLMGDQKYPDLLFLTDRGDVGVVEVKRAGNPELRGRHVISQILDYGATLCSLREEKQAELFSDTSPPAKRLEELAMNLVDEPSRARWVAKSYRDRLRQAQLHYIIACDEAPDGLAEWIRAASRNDATDYQISVLEVSPFVADDQAGEIMWLSQPVIRTETIHRTTVRVIRDEESGELSVNVSSESPDSIAERVESDQPRETVNERALRQALEQLSEQISLPTESIRSALESAHQDGLEIDWQWALDQFADANCKRPVYLRGAHRTGLVEGRFGLNLAHPHRPGIFIGHYLSSHDHGIEVLAKDQGGDFSIILDVNHEWGQDCDFWESPEYLALCSRLQGQQGGWRFSQGENLWHPIMLHQPMAEVLKGVQSESEMIGRWFSFAREGLELLLAGNELQDLRNRLQTDDPAK